MICLCTKFHTPISDDYLVNAIKPTAKDMFLFLFWKEKNYVNESYIFFYVCNHIISEF
jgi:hypothetical protein